MNALLDTECIILGGSVFLHNKDLVLPLIQKQFYREFPALSKGVIILPSALKSYLPDIAALSLVVPEKIQNLWKTAHPWMVAPTEKKRIQ